MELGTGIYSTPLIHWMCVPHQRYVYSLEYDPKYMVMVENFRDEYHKIETISDWDKADIERPWDVVFVDHSPGERRSIEIERLANHAQYIVAHDTEWRDDRKYGYKRIYPLFKYRYDYYEKPYTTVLSNFVDLKDFVPC